MPTITVADIPLLWEEPAPSGERKLVIWLPGFTDRKEAILPHLRDLAAGCVALSFDPVDHGARSRTALPDGLDPTDGSFRSPTDGRVYRHFWAILAQTAAEVPSIIDWAVTALGVAPQVGMGGISMGEEHRRGGRRAGSADRRRRGRHRRGRLVSPIACRPRLSPPAVVPYQPGARRGELGQGGISAPAATAGGHEGREGLRGGVQVDVPQLRGGQGRHGVEERIVLQIDRAVQRPGQGMVRDLVQPGRERLLVQGQQAPVHRILGAGRVHPSPTGGLCVLGTANSFQAHYRTKSNNRTGDRPYQPRSCPGTPGSWHGSCILGRLHSPHCLAR